MFISTLFSSGEDKAEIGDASHQRCFLFCVKAERALRESAQRGEGEEKVFTYKQKRNFANCHNTNNERLCRKVFEEWS